MHRSLLCALVIAHGSVASAREPAPVILIEDSADSLLTTAPMGAVTVIDRQAIEESNARTLAEVLSGQAGIQLTDIFGDGTTTTVDLRGFGSTAPSNVLILIDGRRLNNSADIGAPALNRVPLRQIERIEILRGSAGVRHGNQAVGGVVNIITRDTALAAAFLEVGVGSFDERSAAAAASTPLGERTSLRASANHDETDNYRDHNRLSADLYSLRLDHDYGRGKAFAEITGAREYQQTPGSLFADELATDRKASAPAYAGDFSDTDSTAGRIGLTHDLDSIWHLEGDLDWRQEDRRFVTSFRAFPGSEAEQDRRTWAFRPRLVRREAGDKGLFELTLGMDIERTDYELESQFGVQRMKQEIDGIFAEASLPLTDRLEATAGIRHTRARIRIDTNGDRMDLPDRFTVGSLGLAMHPTTDLGIFLRADQNFRLATVDEHTNVLFGQPVGIKNQQGISYEAGAEWRRGIQEWRLTFYRLDLKDEISFDADTFSNINLEQTRRLGGSLEGSWRLAPGWRSYAQYTYTEGEITDGPFSGNRIPGVARHTARLSIDGRLSSRTTAMAEAVYTGDRILGGDYANAFAPLDAFTVVNAAITYELEGWCFRGRIDNLLDDEYNADGAVGFDDSFTQRAAYFPAPERRFSLTLSYDF